MVHVPISKVFSGVLNDCLFKIRRSIITVSASVGTASLILIKDP
jgi:hypothetical protein